MSLFPNYLRYNHTFQSGFGAELRDTEGKQYLDLSSGIGVLGLGHCHPSVIQALTQQSKQLWHMSNLFENPLQQEVAKELCAQSGLEAAFFCNSGAEANEAAFKLVRKWAHEVKGVHHPEIITFSQSFHGRTLATLTATGQAKVKNGFSPLVPGFVEVPWNDIEAVKAATSTQTAAICLELVQGEGGIYPAHPQFVTELAAWCQEMKILLMIDEVQTGMGRTGKLFAFQYYGIKPHVITLAKGLGNGFPVGAMLAEKSLKEVFSPGTHGTTFGGNYLAMSVAKAVLQELTAPDFLTQVQQKADYFTRQLQEALFSLPLVKEIRAFGLMIGIELHGPAQPYIKRSLEKGLVVLPAGENVIRLLPPLIISTLQIDQAVQTLKQLLEKEGLSQ